MDLGIAGRVAFVAGSTSGMGLAVARALAAEGVAVAVCGRREELARAEATTIAEEFRVPAIGLQCDILERGSLDAAVLATQQSLGNIDILILNGPGPRPGGSETVSAREAVEAAETLIAPHVHMVGRLLPGMKQRNWGRIVAVGSFTMDRASTSLSLSAMGRAGLQRYLEALAREVAGGGVTVNIVQPGLVATDRIDILDRVESQATGIPVAQVRARREASIPFGRLGDPAEFASAVTFLASEPARYITGQSLRVDGGLYSAG